MEDSELLRKRREKIDELKDAGVELYPAGAKITSTTFEVIENCGGLTSQELERLSNCYNLAGRMIAVRNFGKVSFVSLQDRTGRLQIYVARENVGEKDYSIFKKLDVGDIVSVSGRAFRTKTGELTIEAATCRLLSKAVRPLPEKWHGLTDIETRYRLRHLDLITNPEIRKIFLTRSRIIQFIREFMNQRNFLEVETPMMQPRAGGALARPFKTHHNALGMDLYLRIAPELYLKRLITGDMERVYEINRNFRNEGISTLHNPEFTMMEFYQAYATYEDLMTMTEEMFSFLAEKILGSLKFYYQNREIDLTPPWKRVSLYQAVTEVSGLTGDDLHDYRRLESVARDSGIEVGHQISIGKLIVAIFEALVEKTLVQPTFVTGYPVEVSPLARRSDLDHTLTDRFELYICGREIANAFSELNDPVDQRERFAAQQKDRDQGDREAHQMDEDYLSVLEYGMPPTAGEGIGIDRLVMLFTNSPSIREVILFPQLRMKE